MSDVPSDGAPEGATLLTAPDALAAHADALLALEGRASADANAFAYDDPSQALDVRRFLFARGVAEFSPPGAVLRLEGQRVAGFYAVCRADQLRKRRLAGAMALARDGAALLSADALRRLRAVGAIQVAVGADDAYLSRIAVDPAQSGRGLGPWLLARALEDARASGARRCVLDVSEANAGALRFYDRAGFRDVGGGRVEDPATGRGMGQRHLALDL